MDRINKSEKTRQETILDSFETNTFLKYIHELGINELKDAINYTLIEKGNERIKNVFDKKNIIIGVYGSDGRLEKTNRENSSIDLIICSKEKRENLSDTEIRNIIKKTRDKGKKLQIDNSYIEFDEDGNENTIEDSINVGDGISRIKTDKYHVDILRESDALFKYGKYTFPDRLIDTVGIFGDEELLFSFKEKMLKKIIKNPKILEKYKGDVKKYFKEETLNGKNLKKGKEDHFNLNAYSDNILGDYGTIKYDGKNYFGFKHGPMRAVQHKITIKFLEFVVKNKNSKIIRDFPKATDERIYFLHFIGALKPLSEEEIENFAHSYNYFKNKNEILKHKNLISYHPNFELIGNNGIVEEIGIYGSQLNHFKDRMEIIKNTLKKLK